MARRWCTMGWPSRLAWRRDAMGWSGAARLARWRRAMGQPRLGVGTGLGMGIRLGMACGGRHCCGNGMGRGERIVHAGYTCLEWQALCLASRLGLLGAR